jgi:hypothetical protein
VTKYTSAQSPFEFLRNIFEIYRKHFITLSSIYYLPMFILMLFTAVITKFTHITEFTHDSRGPFPFPSPLHFVIMFIIIFTLQSFLIFVIMQATTACVSDICLGNSPGITGSFKRIFGQSFKQLLITTILMELMVFLGSLLLIIPGIIFSLWYLFSPQVALLEGISGWKALRRSKELCKGYNLRNAGILLICILFLLIYSVSINVTYIFILKHFGINPFDISTLKHFGINPADISTLRHFNIYLMISNFLLFILQNLFTPIVFIVPVLIYYDLRVRKEAYGS